MIEIADIRLGRWLQLDTWFGDVYAEILHFYISSAEPMKWGSVYFPVYSKGGQERWECSEPPIRIRRIVDAPPINAIIYGAVKYRGGWPGHAADWPAPITHGKLWSNRREKLEKGKP